MKKTLLATLVALLGCAAGPRAYAEPGVMIGISHNFGGSTGITLKLLSSRDKNKAALAAGVTYFPWTSGSSWGTDVGLGYTFDRGALTFGYDFLNSQFQMGLGLANTRSRPTPAPAPVPAAAPAAAPALASAAAPAAAPARAPAPASSARAPAAAAAATPSPAPAPAPAAAPVAAPAPAEDPCLTRASAAPSCAG